MKRPRSLSAIGLAAGMIAYSMGGAHTASITPTFDTFGPLPAASFSGSGIPDDAVAIKTIADGSNIITLGMNAAERFLNPPVGGDGTGTFCAGTGTDFGDPTFATTPGPLGAIWNFDFYVSISGSGLPEINDYDVALLYDFDPGAGTDESLHGEIDFSAVVGLLPDFEGSEYLLFGFLSVPFPGILTPPQDI